MDAFVEAVHSNMGSLLLAWAVLAVFVLRPVR